ncbi:MAG: DUF2589 domain-containing protein [Halapricum sp.]
MGAIDDLENLPLSHLFSGPLIAAIDASVQSQSEKVDLLLETGFDEDGDLVTVAFSYTTTEIDPDTGAERRVAKEIQVPLLLFLTLPNLQVSQITEEFSAEITEVEDAERSSTGSYGYPLRLNVRPAGQSTTFDRKTKSTFDLDIKMVAELQNESTGMEIIERAANNATMERVDERRTERLAEGREEPTITPERVHEEGDD